MDCNFSVSLGVCLYGNEEMNRRVNSAVDSVDDVDRNIQLARIQVGLLTMSAILRLDILHNKFCITFRKYSILSALFQLAM